MAVVQVEPDVPIIPRAALENLNHIVEPETKIGEHNYFQVPIVQSILDNLRLGLKLEDCSNLASVPYKIVKRWRADNVSNFELMCLKAEAECKKLHLMKVTRGGADWKPSAFVLERKWKDEWGKDNPKQAAAAGERQTFMIGGKEVEF